MVNPQFWKNKKVLITGHTGFKGGWLSVWLNQLGAKVYGYSLIPENAPNLYTVLNIEDIIEESIIGDIRDFNEFRKRLLQIEPDIILHLAAQPIVRTSYVDPILTYQTNVDGTINLLQIARELKNLKVLVNVTTDKVYLNREVNYAYVENDQLGGFDPYSCSKACSELITSSFRSSFFDQLNISIATARAGNVIGGGDWSADRIIPDAFRALSNNENLLVRSPNSIRPWQHVLEPLFGYILLCQKLYFYNPLNNSAWNFGPSDENGVDVLTIVNMLKNLLGDSFNFEISEKVKLHEAQILKINSAKSNLELNWYPKWDIQSTILETTSWYKAYYNNDDMLLFTLNQIDKYQNG